MTDIDELQVRLVDQSGCLERVAATFMSHVAFGNAAKLGMDHGDELLERSFIPLSPGDEEVRNFNSCRKRHRYPSPAVIVCLLPSNGPFRSGFPPPVHRRYSPAMAGGRHGPQYTDCRIGAVGGAADVAIGRSPVAERSTVRVLLRRRRRAGWHAGTCESEAAAVFERSQISLEWIDARACEARCLFVRILAKPIGTESRKQPVVGIAPGTPEAPGKFAWVFYDRICSYSADLQLDAALMIGHVIAHELGHLPLPHGAHSLAGIMRPAWDRAQANGVVQGVLTFSRRRRR